MNWKLIPFGIPAIINSLAQVVLFNGRSNGFSEWVADREYQDPTGKPFQTREQAVEDQKQKSK